MGRFLQSEFGLGSKGLFGIKTPAPPAGFVIQAAVGPVGGFSAAITGYNGNSTVLGPGLTGSVISVGVVPPPPTVRFDLGIGDGNWSIAPLAPPYFGVSNGGPFPQNNFTSVTINGHTYLTAAADFFDNGAGCGPTLWAWIGIAGLVAGVKYPVVFV